MYLESSVVNNFPSTKRAQVNKLMTENSVTRLINRLIDVNGYVITSEISLPDNFPCDIPVGQWGADGVTRPFEFSLRGYYFCVEPQESGSPLTGINYLINSITEETPGADNIYAIIGIDYTNKDYPELSGQVEEENTGKYKGVQFSATDSSSLENPDAVKYSMLLATKVDGNWVVPFESINKFDTRSIKDIDGGEMIF